MLFVGGEYRKNGIKGEGWILMTFKILGFSFPEAAVGGEWRGDELQAAWAHSCWILTGDAPQHVRKYFLSLKTFYGLSAWWQPHTFYHFFPSLWSVLNFETTGNFKWAFQHWPNSGSASSQRHLRFSLNMQLTRLFPCCGLPFSVKNGENLPPDSWKLLIQQFTLLNGLQSRNFKQFALKLLHP